MHLLANIETFLPGLLDDCLLSAILVPDDDFKARAGCHGMLSSGASDGAENRTRRCPDETTIAATDV